MKVNLEKFFYNKKFEKVKSVFQKNTQMIINFVILLILLCPLYKKVNDLKKNLNVNQSSYEKTFDEQNLETYNKKMFLEISARIDNVNENLTTLNNLLSENNLVSLKNEIKTLEDVQLQFVELLQLEVDTQIED